jgi:hypothetical protein
MRMPRFLVGLIAFAVGALAFAATAEAQATRTWVSGVGDDANPCSRTAPCKTFAGAISKTAAQGEINCLDPAGFGAVTITKPISIICDAVSNGGVLVSGTNGIVVNVASSTAQVVLSGLDFEGIGPGAGAGTNGVQMFGLGHLLIRNCIIRDFAQYGVNEAGGPNAHVDIFNTLITNNTLGGLYVLGSAGATNNAIIDQSVFDNNGAASVTIAGPGIIFISRSMFEGNTNAYVISGGGTITSYGDNIVRGGTTTPTNTLPQL